MPIPEDHKFIRYDEDNDRDLNRVYAGFVPPGEQPGFTTVIGESLYLPQKFYVMAEYEDFDLGNLLRQTMEMHADLKVQMLYGPMDDALNGFLIHLNRQRADNGLDTIHFSYPYRFDGGNVSYHLNMIREALRTNSKSLYLGDASKVQSALQQIPSNLPDAPCQKYPIVAAAGWPLAALMSMPQNMHDDTGPAMAVTKYDLFPRFGRS